VLTRFCRFSVSATTSRAMQPPELGPGGGRHRVNGGEATEVRPRWRREVRRWVWPNHIYSVSFLWGCIVGVGMTKVRRPSVGVLDGIVLRVGVLVPGERDGEENSGWGRLQGQKFRVGRRDDFGSQDISEWTVRI
jgi:hypothetical protein